MLRSACFDRDASFAPDEWFAVSRVLYQLPLNGGGYGYKLWLSGAPLTEQIVDLLLLAACDMRYIQFVQCSRKLRC
jgi:hypothetical protein